MSPHHHNANDFHHSLNDAYHARLHHPHLCDVRGRRAHSASPARGSPRYRERDCEHELRPGTPASVHSSSSEFGDADIIPPYHPAAPRTLVLCFDGTGDQFDSDNSNVVKFFSLLKRDDRREQMVYYQTGIGTYTSPSALTPVGTAMSKTLDQAVAWNLDSHVMSGYEFLMQNYEAGDKICLFGFSRGAYTARALAGMLHKVGLLPSHNHQQIPFAYKMYSRTDEVGWKQSTMFKKAFSVDVTIEFIGVWDTVCSVGIIPHRLPFVASNTAIRTFRHALSLDERRAKFKANHYNRPTAHESKLGTHDGDMPRPVSRGSLALRRASRTHSHSRSQSGDAKEGKGKAMSPSRLVSAFKAVTGRRGSTDEEKKGGEVTTAIAAVETESPTGEKRGAIVAAAEDGAERVEATVEAEAEKGAAVVAEVVEGAEETAAAAAGAMEKGAGAVAEAVEKTGSRLWAGARTLVRRQQKKRQTEEEHAFDASAIDAVPHGETDVKEVWFAGCHCDVGGGSVLDTEHHSLARIPLRWMVRECFRTGTGIRFHSELLKDIGMDPATLWPTPREPWVFGPGLAHAPQLPALVPSPRISLDPPTPPDRPRAHVEELERRVLRQLHADEHVHASSLPPASSDPSDAARRASSEDTHASGSTQTHAYTHGGEHSRHISVSTTRTLVGDTATARFPPRGFRMPPDDKPVPEVDEAEEERQDALCQIFDQLALKPWWWLLEVIPMQQRMQLLDNTWKPYTTFNMGRGRTAPMDKPHIYVHRSVKLRMEAKKLRGGPYLPKLTNWAKLKPIYVD